MLMNPYEILRTQLTRALEPICEDSSERVVDAVLRTLEQQRVVSYGKSTDIRLLSSAGRVFIAALENPDMTQRALGKYLGMQEQQVFKVVKNLEHAGLLVTTKSGQKKVLRFGGIDALRHPDISRFFDVIATLIRENIGNEER